MRREVLDYIRGLNLGSYSVSDEVPRDESGTPLYIKNPKRIYVDVDQYSETPLVSTLSGLNIHTYSQTVTVVFSNDAKLLPNNYDALIGQLIFAKDINTEAGFNSREAVVTTNIQSDLLVSQIEITYTRIR
jgi:hypothetical protein